MQPIVSISNLSKTYAGGYQALKNVNLDIQPGEILALLGPNGAGKTTSFYMIVGLITPNEGKIYLDDADITREPVYRRAQKGIGYLAQEASVFRKSINCRFHSSEFLASSEYCDPFGAIRSLRQPWKICFDSAVCQ